MEDTGQNTSNTLGQAYDYSKSHVMNLIRKWYLLLLGGVLFGGLMFLYAFIDKGNYITHPIFTFESMEETGGMLSAAADMLGMAGPSLNLGGKNSINADYLIALARSKRILKTTLLKEIKVNGVVDGAANHYTRLYNWHDEELVPKDFKFQATSLRDTLYTIEEDSLLSMVAKKIKEDHLNAIYHRETLRLVELIIGSKSRDFTIQFSKVLIKEVEKYFIENQIKREAATVVTLQRRADSIQQHLYEAEYALANWQDTRNRMVKAKGSLREVRLRRDVEIFSILNAEILANLEAAKFSKLQNTPLIYAIDEPEFSIEFKKRAPAIFTAAGLAVGLIFSALMLIVFKSIRDSVAYTKAR